MGFDLTGIRSASTGYLEVRLEVHRDLTVFVRVLAAAFAVKLDVFAVSIDVGVARLALDSSLPVGFAFAGSEIAMQAIGVEFGPVLDDWNPPDYLNFRLAATASRTDFRSCRNTPSSRLSALSKFSSAFRTSTDGACSPKA